MKKLLLSGFVVALFVLYGLNKQGINKNDLNLSNQQVISNQTSSPSIPTDTPVPTSTPPTPTPTSPPVPKKKTTTSNPPPSQGQYKNGTYTGGAADAFYGNVQVQVTISGGRISNVIFLQYPNTHSTSVMINSQAMPYLKQEAIQAQSANVNVISGATYTSQAFVQSLQSALSQAH